MPINLEYKDDANVQDTECYVECYVEVKTEFKEETADENLDNAVKTELAGKYY